MKLTPVGSNQTELVTKSGAIVLFSYSTPVAALVDGKYYRTKQFYSVTTSKHINRWVGADAETVSQDFFDNLVY